MCLCEDVELGLVERAATFLVVVELTIWGEGAE
jgi:hypothetical protein